MLTRLVLKGLNGNPIFLEKCTVTQLSINIERLDKEN